MYKGDIMNILFCLTPKEKVAYIQSDSSIRQALEKMQVHRYSEIPVLDLDGNYLNTVSEGDLLWYIKEKQLDFETSEKTNIMDVPRYKYRKSIDVNRQIEEIIDLFIDQNFVPVVDDYGAFIGIITRKEIFKYMMEKLDFKNKIQIDK